MYMYMEVMTRIEEKRSSVGSRRRRKDRRGQGGGRTGENEEQGYLELLGYGCSIMW